MKNVIFFHVFNVLKAIQTRLARIDKLHAQFKSGGLLRAAGQVRESPDLLIAARRGIVTSGLLLTFASTLLAVEPLVSFEERAVSVSQIVRGSDVVVYSLALRPDGFDSTVLRWAEVLSDTDLDGSVRLDLKQPLPWRSIWVAVEMTGGQFSVVTPAGFPLNMVPVRSGAFRRGESALLDVFSHDAPFLDLLYVHPGGGVWTLKAADGYNSDRDRRSDGVTTIGISQLVDLHAAPSRPTQFLPGGILFAIDLMKMQVSTARLDATSLNEVPLGE